MGINSLESHNYSSSPRSLGGTVSNIAKWTAIGVAGLLALQCLAGASTCGVSAIAPNP
jgi:hypothetical protein